MPRQSQQDYDLSKPFKAQNNKIPLQNSDYNRTNNGPIIKQLNILSLAI